jgi:hypothetical protein
VIRLGAEFLREEESWLRCGAEKKGTRLDGEVGGGEGQG